MRIPPVQSTVISVTKPGAGTDDWDIPVLHSNHYKNFAIQVTGAGAGYTSVGVVASVGSHAIGTGALKDGTKSGYGVINIVNPADGTWKTLANFGNAAASLGEVFTFSLPTQIKGGIVMRVLALTTGADIQIHVMMSGTETGPAR